jgi:branched-chain amino acid transport system substrate-binding protein
MFMSDRGKNKLSRRKFLGVSSGVAAGALVGGLVVGGVAGYFGGQAAVPAPTTVTKTATTTIAGTGATTTQTVTQNVTTTVTTGSTSKPPRTIKVGWTVPLSGNFAPIMSLGEKMLKAAVDAVNSTGGLYVTEYGQRLPMEAVVYDDKSDPATVEKLYTKMATEDNVDIFIGSFTSAGAMVASTVAEKNKIPYVDVTANELPIYKRDYKYIVGQQDTVNLWYKQYLDFLKADGRPKTMAFITNDEPFGAELAGFGSAYAKYLGFNVLVDDTVAQGPIDFTPFITSLKSADPDVVILSGHPVTAQGSFWKQCLEANYKPRDLHPCYGNLAGFQEQLPAGKGNWVTADIMYSPDIPWSGKWGKQFYEQKVRDVVGYKDEDYAEMSYAFSAFEIACAGIENAGTLDKDAVNDALHTMRTMTLCGPWWVQTPNPNEPAVLSKPFDPPRGYGYGVPIQHPIQMQNGKLVILYPPELKTGDYVYPAPLG